MHITKHIQSLFQSVFIVWICDYIVHHGVIAFLMISEWECLDTIAAIRTDPWVERRDSCEHTGMGDSAIGVATGHAEWSGTNQQTVAHQRTATVTLSNNKQQHLEILEIAHYCKKNLHDEKDERTEHINVFHCVHIGIQNKLQLCLLTLLSFKHGCF